jgi:hypothetical protein
MLSFLTNTVSIRIPSRKFRDISQFAAGSSRKSCPSARCALAASNVCTDVDMLNTQMAVLEHILKQLECLCVSSVSLVSFCAV